MDPIWPQHQSVHHAGMEQLCQVRQPHSCSCLRVYCLEGSEETRFTLAPFNQRHFVSPVHSHGLQLSQQICPVLVSLRPSCSETTALGNFCALRVYSNANSLLLYHFLDTRRSLPPFLIHHLALFLSFMFPLKVSILSFSLYLVEESFS